MPRNHFARFSVILLVAAALAAPPAWAAPHRLAAGMNPLDIFARVWDSLAAIWAEEGCNLDPHGGCWNGPAPTVDAGCNVDPHGGCGTALQAVPSPPPTTDAGCNLDPHGSCTPGS